MYALKPSKSNLRPVRPVRAVPSAKLRKRSNPHRAIACEITAKLAVNVVVSMAAVAALVHLLPYVSAQEAKLQELQAAVRSTGERVQGVQSRFANLFDPNQSKENMQELTNRTDPMRRQVVWQAPASASSIQKPTEQGMSRE